MAFSQPAFDKYRSAVKETGTIIIDSDLVKTEEDKVCSAPFTRIADGLGKKVVANSVMLGYLIASTEVISVKSLETAIREEIPEHTIKLNLEAFHRGIRLCHQRK